MPYSCCYKCPKRIVGCHATCDDYLKEKRLNEERNEQIRKQKAARHDFSFDRACEYVMKNKLKKLKRK